MVRLADRYAVPFTLAAYAIGGIAWAIAGDPVRFAEVLVVATPCPLLIAPPVAFLGGMSRAAKNGVMVKSGGTEIGRASCRERGWHWGLAVSQRKRDGGPCTGRTDGQGGRA